MFYINIGYPEWKRLRTITLTSVAVDSSLAMNGESWPSLSLVTYRYEREEAEFLEVLLEDVMYDLPMEVGVEVLMMVGSEEERVSSFRIGFERNQTQGGFRDNGERVLAQVKIEVDIRAQ